MVIVKMKQAVSLGNHVNLGQVLAGGDTAKLSDKQLISDKTDASTLRSWEWASFYAHFWFQVSLVQGRALCLSLA